MKRALLLIGNLQETGGGLMVGAWAAQALARDHRLTVLSWEHGDLADLDRTYGTHLTGLPNIEVIAMPNGLRRAFVPAHGRLALLRSMLLMRLGRRLAARLAPACIVSTAGETDLGRPLLQYIHYPWMAWPRPEVDLRWYHWGPAVRLYRGLAAAIGGYRTGRAARNISLVNSDWTRAVFEGCYGAPASVLHPPVPVEGEGLPWEERDDAVVCIARFSHEKRLLEALAIVRRLRETGHPLDLHLCGLPCDEAYLRRLRAAVAEAGPWAHLHVDLPRTRLFAIAGRCKYGLHAMIDEHFGIAVAEMLRLGCLPFVHRSGGPREIVDDDRLTWADEKEAVARIAACRDDPALCRALRNHAAARGRHFSASAFMDALLAHCARLPEPTASNTIRESGTVL